jgi:hypothetical protein
METSLTDPACLWTDEVSVSSTRCVCVSIYSATPRPQIAPSSLRPAYIELKEVSRDSGRREVAGTVLRLPCNQATCHMVFVLWEAVLESLRLMRDQEARIETVGEKTGSQSRTGAGDDRTDDSSPLGDDFSRRQIENAILSEFSGRTAIVRTISQHLADAGWNVSARDLREILSDLRSRKAIRSETRVAKAGHNYVVWTFP